MLIKLIGNKFNHECEIIYSFNNLLSTCNHSTKIVFHSLAIIVSSLTKKVLIQLLYNHIDLKIKSLLINKQNIFIVFEN
jgi:hypothetical protein